jgi:hypothetical protein
MPLKFERTRGRSFRTGTYLFDMRDGDKSVQCGVSDEAMDDAEPGSEVKAYDRDAQFVRLKDRILECANRKYYAGELEEAEPRILIRRYNSLPRGYRQARQDHESNNNRMTSRGGHRRAVAVFEGLVPAPMYLSKDFASAPCRHLYGPWHFDE